MINAKGCRISYSQIVLSLGMPLFRRFLKPESSLLTIFVRSCTEGISSAQLKLGFHVPLLSLLF